MQKTNFPRIHYIIYIYFFQQEKEIFIKIFVFLADCLFYPRVTRISYK